MYNILFFPPNPLKFIYLCLLSGIMWNSWFMHNDLWIKADSESLFSSVFQPRPAVGLCQDCNENDMVRRAPYRGQPEVLEKPHGRGLQKTDSREAQPSQRWALAATGLDRRWKPWSLSAPFMRTAVPISCPHQLFICPLRRKSASWFSCCQVGDGSYLD